MFAPSNVVFTNNELPIALRLVGTYQSTYVSMGGGNSTTDLLRFALPNDGYMDDIHAERDRVGADVVLLMNTNSAACGYGYVLHKNDPNSAEWAFGLVRSDCWSIPFVMLHEVGHLMGLTHDVASTPLAPYDNGHGYKAPNNAYFTVMVQNNPTGTIPYFSSGTRLYNNLPLGDPIKADAETVLWETAPIVSNYRPPGC